MLSRWRARRKMRWAVRTLASWDAKQRYAFLFCRPPRRADRIAEEKIAYAVRAVWDAVVTGPKMGVYTKTQHLICSADDIHRSLPFPEEVPGMGTLTGDVKEWARRLDGGGISDDTRRT